MFDQFSNKYDIIVPTTLTDNNTVTGVLDTASYDANSLTVIAIVGSVDIGVTAIKLQHSDTNGSFTDITGANFNSAVLTGNDDNKILIQPLDLRGKKRYINFTATVADGTAGCQLTVLGILGDCGKAPLENTIASYGADVLFAGSVV